MSPPRVRTAPCRPRPGHRCARLCDNHKSRNSPVAGSAKTASATHRANVDHDQRFTTSDRVEDAHLSHLTPTSEPRRARRRVREERQRTTHRRANVTTSTTGRSPPATGSKIAPSSSSEPQASRGAPVAGSTKNASAFTGEPTSITSSAPPVSASHTRIVLSSRPGRDPQRARRRIHKGHQGIHIIRVPLGLRLDRRAARRRVPDSNVARRDPLTSRGSPVAGSLKAVKAVTPMCAPRARPAPRRPRPGRRRAPSCPPTRSRAAARPSPGLQMRPVHSHNCQR